MSMQPFTGTPLPAPAAAQSTGYHHGIWQEQMDFSIGISAAMLQVLDRMGGDLALIGAGKLKMVKTSELTPAVTELIAHGAQFRGKTEAEVRTLLEAVIDVGPENIALSKHNYRN